MRRAVPFIVAGALVLLVALIGVQATLLLRPTAAPTPTATALIDWAAVPAGADASWPACTPPSGTKRTLPLAVRPAFVVIGVNDGLPGTRSACIERELAWADTVTGGSTRPALEYYVMAADPWTPAERRWVRHPAWPDSNRVGAHTVDVPAAYASAAHGTTCSGGHAEAACGYVYGWTTALRDVALPGLRDPHGTRFWIDVEATRDWSGDPLLNEAIVEGMAAGFAASPEDGGAGTTTGIYSDQGEWQAIVGGLRDGSPLDALPEWLAVGRVTKAEAAESLLHDPALTPGGTVVMVQYMEGGIDRDLARP